MSKKAAAALAKEEARKARYEELVRFWEESLRLADEENAKPRPPRPIGWRAQPLPDEVAVQVVPHDLMADFYRLAAGVGMSRLKPKMRVAVQRQARFSIPWAASLVFSISLPRQPGQARGGRRKKQWWIQISREHAVPLDQLCESSCLDPLLGVDWNVRMLTQHAPDNCHGGSSGLPCIAHCKRIVFGPVIIRKSRKHDSITVSGTMERLNEDVPLEERM